MGHDYDQQACYNDFRGYTLAVSAAVWARLDVKYSNWPWRLLRGVTSSVQSDLVDSELNSFYDEDECCLDSWCGLWLRAKLQSRLVAQQHISYHIQL